MRVEGRVEGVKRGVLITFPLAILSSSSRSSIKPTIQKMMMSMLGSFGGVSGGNTSTMRKAMHDSNTMAKTKRRLVKGAFLNETRKRQVVSLPKVSKVFLEKKQSSAKTTSSTPVQSVYVHESKIGRNASSTPKTKSKTLKFAPEAKVWCGLREERRLYDELIFQFFVEGKQFSSVDVLRLIGMDSNIAKSINSQLVDLCTRIQKQVMKDDSREESGVPVLLFGGGNGMKVTSFHLPYLQSLQQVCAEAERVVSLGFSLDESKSCEDDQEVNI